MPTLIRRFDQYEYGCNRDVIKLLGECGESPRLSLPFLWRVFSREEDRYLQEEALVSIAKIIHANDLDERPVIQAAIQTTMQGWRPHGATATICKLFGDKATPLIEPLLKWLEQGDNAERHNIAAVARCFASIGPSAKEGALILKDEIDQFQDSQLTDFLQSLAKAGLDEPLVPIALDLLDDSSTRRGALLCLAAIGPAADACVPKLIELMDDRYSRQDAIETLLHMGKPSQEATEKLKALTRDGYQAAGLALMRLFPEDQEIVRFASRKIGTLSLTDVEKLQAALTDQQLASVKAAIAAEMNGEAPASVMPKASIQVTEATFGTKQQKSDITQIVQRLVDKENSLVNLTAQGLGIRDPAVGKDKSLVIQYTINGQEYSKTIPGGPKKRPLNLRKELLPGDSVAMGSAPGLPSGQASVKKLSEFTWRLEPHLTIGVPSSDFTWKLRSTEPVVFECRSENGEQWIRLSPMPAINDFARERQQAVLDYQQDVATQLQDAGAIFPNGTRDVTHYGDDRFQGLEALMFGYTKDNQEYSHFIGRLFRSQGSYLFEISAPDEVPDMLLGVVRMMDLDIDNNHSTPVPEEIRKQVAVELEKLEKILDAKTDDEIERMIEYVAGPRMLKAMKNSGDFAGAAKHFGSEISPLLLGALKVADWQAAELRENGNVVFFPGASLWPDVCQIEWGMEVSFAISGCLQVGGAFSLHLFYLPSENHCPYLLDPPPRNTWFACHGCLGKSQVTGENL